ncbi:unnamed protein product [Coregonus sp. 'balchen']|nr:unnamed protein product [Coregonus sp. 'balchen']
MTTIATSTTPTTTTATPITRKTASLTPEKPQLKRQVVRAKMTPKDPNLNLSDPAAQDVILQEPDGKVFNKEKEGSPKKEEEEERKMKKRKKRMMTKREL